MAERHLAIDLYCDLRGCSDCVVTSPPYWGLRDCGIPPVVFGGDSECQHEWGDHVVERATNHTDKRRWQHTRNGRDREARRLATHRGEAAINIIPKKIFDCRRYMAERGRGN